MKKILFPLTLILPLLAQNFSLLDFKHSEFSPALGEKFTIPIKLDTEGNLTVTILTPDNNPIRTFYLGYRKKGIHKVVWDGKDKWGETVPDEAYALKVTLTTTKETQTVNYRATGGAILHDLKRRVDRFGNIQYFLKEPARVLVRAGVLNGPLLDIISNWEPKSRGSISQKWNFSNQDHIDFSDAPFAVSISAFSLPKHSIITKNNKKENYLHYFKRHNFSCNLQQLKLNSTNEISPHAFECRVEQKIPSVKMYLTNNGKQIQKLKNDQPVQVHVEMPKEDEKLIASKQFEVSFYIDYKFASEAEQGYLPISWRFTPNGLKPQRHILTVNITTLTGQVATKSIYFTID